MAERMMAVVKRVSLPVLVFLFVLNAGQLQAQHPPGPGPNMPGGPGQGWPGPDGQPPPPMQPNHGPMDRSMHVGPPGKWWSDPRFAQHLGLTVDQQKRMDSVFDQSRVKLIDLSAALQKQEAILEPLLAADHPDEPKILDQIDRVAQARAELEKGNARMLLGLRAVLTQEQWARLQAEAPRPNQRPRR